MRLATTLAGALLASLCVSSSAWSQEPGGSRLQFHGFGNWAYGRTDGNQYLSGSHEGSYAHMNFDLNVSAVVTPRLRIQSQVFWDQGAEGSEAGVLLSSLRDEERS